MTDKIRKYASVFGLYARGSIFKVLGILLCMSGIQIGLFLKCYVPSSGWSYENPFVVAVTDCGIPKVFAVTFLVVTILLCRTGTEYSSKTGYTLRRLCVSERATFFCQAIYNVFVYILFLATQIVVIFGLGMIFLKSEPENYRNVQAIFLAFYSDGFLHAVLPLEDIGLWGRNFCWLVALGMTTAEFSYLQRRGNKFNMSLIFMVIMAVGFWKSAITYQVGMNKNSFITGFLALLVVGVVLSSTVFVKEDSYEN